MGWNGGAGAGGGSAVGTRVTHSTTSLYNTGVWTSHAFDTETVDDAGWHSTTTNNSRITVDAGGWYSIVGRFEHVASSLGDFRGQRILLNGTTPIATTMEVDGTATLPVAGDVPCLYYLSAGDYVELQGYQNTGVNGVGANANGWSALEVVRLG